MTTNNLPGKFLGNLIGLALLTGMAVMFFQQVMAIPVMEVDRDGTCLRVINGEGQPVQNGCKLARKGKIATESRVVAK